MDDPLVPGHNEIWIVTYPVPRETNFGRRESGEPGDRILGSGWGHVPHTHIYFPSGILKFSQGKVND